MKKVNRRRFLKGAGGAALALPFLTKLHGPARAAADAPPTRIIVMSYAMGCVSQEFQPRGTGSSFTLPFITAPLERHRDRCLFVSNLDNASQHLVSSHAFGHDGKKESALTGTLMVDAFGGDGSNHIDNLSDGPASGGPNNESVENFIGRRILQGSHARASIDLGVTGRPERDRPEYVSEFFFEGPSNPVTLQQNPARAFDMLFAGITPDGPMVDPAVVARRQRSHSVLDAVRASFTELRSGLDARDRRRLDDHAALIRSIEVEIEERAACAPPAGALFMGGREAAWEPFSSMGMVEMGPLMNTLMAAGMGCGLAPVGRIQFTEQHNPFFGIPLVDDEVAQWRGADDSTAWHTLVHGEPSPVTGVPTRDDGSNSYSMPLLTGYRSFVESFADLLDKLAATPEGPDGESVLDHTLCVLCSDFGNGNGHSANKMNWILAGNTGVTGRVGYHFDAAGRDAGFYTESAYDVNHLLTSIIQMMGVRHEDGSEVQEFGLQGFHTGIIPDLFE